MIHDPYNFYLLVSETCLKNAKQFLKDAILLRENRSYGHAYALAVLSFEELAKAWGMIDLFFGKSPDSEDILKFQTNHQIKQFYGWKNMLGFLFFDWLELTGYKEEFQKLIADDSLSGKAREKRLWQIIKQESKTKTNSDGAIAASNLLQLRDVLELLENDPNYMNNKKQKGFYVDYNLAKKKIISSPDSFILADLELIDTLDWYIPFTERFHEELKDSANRKKIRTFIQKFRKIWKEASMFEQTKEES